jgi:hypothetical protein
MYTRALPDAIIRSLMNLTMNFSSTLIKGFLKQLWVFECTLFPGPPSSALGALVHEQFAGTFEGITAQQIQEALSRHKCALTLIIVVFCTAIPGADSRVPQLRRNGRH